MTIEYPLEFKNSKENGLGIPLPKGIVRAYQESSDGSVLLIGEDQIKHTPKNEKVSLKMGEAFDVTVERKQTNFEKLGRNLVELDFYYNHIRKIPDGIGNLTKLKQLFLSYNQIQLLPDTLAALKRLKYMYIHHNGLAVAPQWITTLPKLERLDLSYNRLDSIPDLSHMENLVEIDLQHNELKRFPWELLDKENLNFLIFKNNPFVLTNEEEKILKQWQKNQKPFSRYIVY